MECEDLCFSSGIFAVIQPAGVIPGKGEQLRVRCTLSFRAIQRLTKILLSVEDHPLGYPRFSALVGAHSSFHLGRRFSNLRARLLLLKQDKLSLLEKRLENIDREETALLNLGSCRSDDNHDRQLVLSEIEHALADYGMFSDRYSCQGKSCSMKNRLDS